MIRTIAIAALIVTGSAAVSMQASAADEVVRQIAWNGAPSLDIGVPAKMTFTQSPTVRMTVTGPSEAVNRVYLDGDSLRYRSTWGWFGNDWPRGLRIDISAPSMKTLGVHSGGDMTIPNLNEATLTLRVNSGAKVRANTNLDALSAFVHSGASLTATGRADRLQLNVHSGAHADLGGLAVDYADINVHSGASATVNPRVSADATAHSGASVRMVSRPQQLSMSKHSGGSIRIP